MTRFSQLLFDLTFGAPAKKPESTAPSIRKPKEKQSTATSNPRNPRGREVEWTKLVQEWSSALGMHQLAKRVSVRCNPRLKTTAGTACPQTWTIDLNRKLEDYGDDVTIRILKHELAHLIAHDRVAGRRIAAHGVEWRHACADLGIPNEKSRHTLPFKATRQRRKYAYQCPVCSAVVLRVRKLARHSACWACCRKHNRGRYAQRFELTQIPLEKGILLSALEVPES